MGICVVAKVVVCAAVALGVVVAVSCCHSHLYSQQKIVLTYHLSSIVYLFRHVSSGYEPRCGYLYVDKYGG